MSLIHWNDNLSVGVEEIDKQHKGLVDMINSLYDNMKVSDNKEFITDLLSKLKDYTIYHFNKEEELMQRHKYPALADQQAKHKDFCTKVFQIEKDLKGGNAKLSMEILNFLSDWLITHINGTDKKMGEFLEKMRK